jgi:hypothetical protein
MSPSIISRHALLLQPTLRLAQSQSQSLRHSVVAAYRTRTGTGTGTGLTTTRSISISCLAKQRHHSSSVKLPSSLSLSLSLSPPHHPHPAYRLFSSSSNGARVKEVKNELLDSIERDVHELSADEEQSATVQEYVTENGWTLEEGRLREQHYTVLYISMSHHSLSLSFALTVCVIYSTLCHITNTPFSLSYLCLCVHD